MSRPSWNWPGSRWWRVDFHTHSPASYDFKNREANGNDNERWVKWITAARDAGLEAVAITDHNTADGIEHLQNACSQVEHAPVLFPGAEITANDGCHLLLIMDPDHGRDHVNDFLARVGIEQENRGKPEARSPQSVENILEKCNDKVLILGAHVNSKDNGLLKHGGRQRIAELNHPRLAGVEVVPDKCLEDEKLLAPENYESWLDGSKAEIKRKFQPVWSSDAHCFTDLGRRWTWVKMTSPTLEGLRLALLDGAGSLKPSQAEDDNHNVPPELAIESITVDQGKFMGRPEPITIHLNPYLNTIIGGRGTGKSTIIDFCRMTLRRQDELESNQKGEEPLKDSFDRRMKIPKNRKEEGLLTQQTKAEIVYR
uniref:PHP domain-containing protein n=1 Tax=Candidatus Synechococcus spongiarum TaxID=431041 RepID=UPI00191BDB0F